MSRNTIFSSFVKCLFVISLFQLSTITVKAEQVTLGGFTGTLTTTVSSGLAMRTEANDCKLISGDSFIDDTTLAIFNSFLTFTGVILSASDMFNATG